MAAARLLEIGGHPKSLSVQWDRNQHQPLSWRSLKVQGWLEPPAVGVREGSSLNSQYLSTFLGPRGGFQQELDRVTAYWAENQLQGKARWWSEAGGAPLET